MDLKIFFYACFVLRIYSTSAASQLENIIGPKECTLQKKAEIFTLDKIKKQYMSERGFDALRTLRGDNEQLDTLEDEKLKEVCQCVGHANFNRRAELPTITVNKDFVYRTKPFILSWFGYFWDEVAIKCEVKDQKFYLIESQKYCSKRYHRNLYIFQLETEFYDDDPEAALKDEKSKKLVIDYPKGDFSVLYPNVYMKMYLKEKPNA